MSFSTALNRLASVCLWRRLNLTIRPTHRRDFINANLLIAKVLNRVYESGRVCHKERIPNPVRLVKYIITEVMAKVSDDAALELPMNDERKPEKKINRHIVIALRHMNVQRKSLTAKIDSLSKERRR